MDPSKNRYPLANGCLEVVEVWDGGDPEVGVVLVLWRGVGSIAVARGTLGDAGVSVVREFGCFFILALHTAHHLYSIKSRRNTDQAEGLSTRQEINPTTSLKMMSSTTCNRGEL